MTNISLFQEWIREMNGLRSIKGESISVKPETWVEVSLRGRSYGLSFILLRDDENPYTFKDEGTLTLWEKEKNSNFIKAMPFVLGVFKKDNYDLPVLTEDKIPVLQRALDEILIVMIMEE